MIIIGGRPELIRVILNADTIGFLYLTDNIQERSSVEFDFARSVCFIPMSNSGRYLGYGNYQEVTVTPQTVRVCGIVWVDG